MTTRQLINAALFWFVVTLVLAVIALSDGGK